MYNSIQEAKIAIRKLRARRAELDAEEMSDRERTVRKTAIDLAITQIWNAANGKQEAD